MVYDIFTQISLKIRHWAQECDRNAPTFAFSYEFNANLLIDKLHLNRDRM